MPVLDVTFPLELVTLPEVVLVEILPLDVEVDDPPLPPELVEVDEPVVELSISMMMLITTPIVQWGLQ